jgi:hypothetical protein
MQEVQRSIKLIHYATTFISDCSGSLGNDLRERGDQSVVGVKGYQERGCLECVRRSRGTGATRRELKSSRSLSTVRIGTKPSTRGISLDAAHQPLSIRCVDSQVEHDRDASSSKHNVRGTRRPDESANRTGS